MATLTETLSNGLKSLFSGLGAKTTDSNYAVPLVNKNDATPTGYMGMTDFAAVMAGVVLSQVSIEQADNITDSGLHRVNGTSATLAEADWGIIYHLTHNTNIMHQIKFCANVNKVLYRKKTSGTWGSWVTIV